VNTLNGEIRYNGGTAAGNSLLAVVTPDAASSLTNTDFIYTSIV
jgi:hypothetical protein